MLLIFVDNMVLTAMTFAKDRYDIIKKKFPLALKVNRGNVANTCEELGVSRNAFYTWYREDQDLDEKYSFHLKLEIHLHCVKYGQSRLNRTARAINIKRDICFRIR
jgi:hypothetical protein